ncbi:hypothetical protein [Corynebacterium aquilae]|nr:hypothetical protein [Corynebacterium aquilae]
MKIDFSKEDEQLSNPRTGWFFTILTVAFTIAQFIPALNTTHEGFTGMSTWGLVALMCALISVIVAVRVRNIPMGVIALAASVVASLGAFLS